MSYEESATEYRLKQNEAALEKISSKIEQLYELLPLIKQLQTDLNTIKRDLKEMQEKLFSYSSQTKDLQTKINEFEKIKYLEFEVKILQKEVLEQRQEIDYFNSMIERIHNDMVGIKTDLVTIEKIKEHNNRTIATAIAITSVVITLLNFLLTHLLK